MFGPEFGAMIGRGILALAVTAFAAGAALMGLAVWLWPYLPSVRLVWGD
jgi:hypothetical protein